MDIPHPRPRVSVHEHAASSLAYWCAGRYVRLADDDVTVGAVIIGTAEYCSEVVGALGRNVAKLLDPPLGDQVRGSIRMRGCQSCKLHDRSSWCPTRVRGKWDIQTRVR